MSVNLWRGIWAALNTEIEISLSSTVTKGIESIRTTLEIVRVLKENEQAPELAPLVGKLSSLLDILNSPLSQVIGTTLPFASLGIELLKFITEQTNEEPGIEVCIAIVGQIAYLESFQQFLTEYSRIHPGFVMNRKASQAISRQIQALGEVEITHKEAEEILDCFHTSKLAREFNPVLVARLQDAGFKENLAKRFTERVSRSAHRHMKHAFFKAKEVVSQLTNVYGSNWEQELQDQISLDNYLRDQISSETNSPEHQNRWQVFDEPFTIKDIYVSLNSCPLDRTGRPAGKPQTSLQDWVEQFLDDPDPTKNKQVMFIQAAPGRGKTVFCRMFADWAKENLHPIWTPILIRLRDIGTLETNFEVTLQASVNARFAKNDRWLHNPNNRFLFLLDGFDELLMEGRTASGLKRFLEQVGQFQQTCQAGPEMQHRVLITGRTLALQEIERNLPSNLERLEILPMSKSLQEEWLTQWGKAIHSEEKANAFRRFLSSPNIPKSVVGTTNVIGLAQEPLLLYLLATMHRHGDLKATMFEAVGVEHAKILIYEKSLEWALSRRRNASDTSDSLSRRLVMLDPEDLRRILQEAGLCVIQSGGEWAPFTMISERLKDDENARQFLESAQLELGESPLRNALISFYLKPADNRREGGVEFVHKSFGEFLCAERIKDSLDLWAKLGEHKNRRFYIDTPKIREEIYDLFGYGYLSSEVVDFLIGLISSEISEIEKSSGRKKRDKREEEIRVLFSRLENFFEGWCRGEFIDDCTEKIPLKTAQKLKPFLNKPLGQRQVDIYTGLNIFIILMKLHQMNISELNFNLSKSLDESKTWLRISSVISYCGVLGPSAFVQVVGKFLSRAQLQNAHLRRVDLKGANLIKADLTGTDLCRADLTGADLTGAVMHYAYLRGADLKEVNLSKAKLINADLCRAYLYNANLRKADLSYASVKGANLEGANFEGANLEKIIWDATTQWLCCEGLPETEEKIPETLRTDEDFRDAIDLSRCLKELKDKNRNSSNVSLSERWLVIAKRIKTRRGNSVYAHVLNKFAWLNCLYGYSGENIVNTAREAVKTIPNSGNYMDTFAIALAMHNDAERIGLLPDNLDSNDTIYRNSIQYLEKALDSDDFKKLALPVADKLRQRRRDWIEELKHGRNPFTPEVLAILLREER